MIMEQKEIEKLQTAIKSVCPQEYEMEIKQTKRARVHLVVIKEPPRAIDVSDWCIFFTFPLHASRVSRLLDKPGDLRTLYCCGDMFVLFSPLDGVFRNFTGVIRYNVYGTEFNQHYVGECEDISKLVEFITETPHLLF